MGWQVGELPMNRAEHFCFPEKIEYALCFSQVCNRVGNLSGRPFDFFINGRQKTNLVPPFGAAVLADGSAGDIEYAGNVFLLHPLLPQVLGERAPQRRDDIKRFNFLRQEELFNHS